jgi:hypothetical protein
VVQELVMERFRVLERIGSGGMGTVYRAYDERLQRHVALKELQAADPDRVLREAQAAARLNHPAIVTLYELGEHGGRAVLVSELVPGETLATLEATGVLCDRDVAEITADLCDALAHAHARGVVHRDIKPQNVIVGDDPRAGRRAKLMDFGIARIAGAPTLTAAGEVVGTLAYMSPEQAEGELAGPETDVYSLALTAYECWAGLNPVAGQTPAQTARQIGTGLAPLRSHRPDLPEGLADTIDACLEPEPELRPSPRELRECLEAELPALDAVHALPPAHGQTELEGGHHRPRLGRGRVLTLAVVGLALLTLAGPIGAPGAALTLALLCVPSLIAGATASSLAPLLAPALSAAGIGGAGAALGAGGTTVFPRAALGVGAWAWMVVASLTLGIGPDLGISAEAPAGWSASGALAAEHVLGPLVSLESLVGACLFAAASVLLGWVLAARHLPLVLLGAMIWAAGLDASLSLVADGGLGGHPAGVVLAATVAVAVEFGLRRSRAGSPSLGLRASPGPTLAPTP